MNGSTAWHKRFIFFISGFRGFHAQRFPEEGRGSGNSSNCVIHFTTSSEWNAVTEGSMERTFQHTLPPNLLNQNTAENVQFLTRGLVNKTSACIPPSPSFSKMLILSLRYCSKWCNCYLWVSAPIHGAKKCAATFSFFSQMSKEKAEHAVRALPL